MRCIGNPGRRNADGGAGQVPRGPVCYFVCWALMPVEPARPVYFFVPMAASGTPSGQTDNDMPMLFSMLSRLSVNAPYQRGKRRMIGVGVPAHEDDVEGSGPAAPIRLPDRMERGIFEPRHLPLLSPSRDLSPGPSTGFRVFLSIGHHVSG